MKTNHIKFTFIFILMMVSSSLLSNSVLVIHGLSCSGKTTICKYLQTYFNQPPCISIDDHAWKLWIKLAIQLNIVHQDTPMLEKYRLITEQSSTIAPYLTSEIPQAIQQLYLDCQISTKNNPHVILDTVFYIISTDEIDFFWQTMKNVDVFITLAYCSPIHMVQRLIKRNSNLEDRSQYRRGYSALFTFCKIYQPTTPENGFAVLTQNEVDQALDMLKNYLLETQTDSTFTLEKIAKLQNNFYTHFFPHNEKSVYITSETPYDFFINTEDLTPEKHAETIYQQYLQKNQKRF